VSFSMYLTKLASAALDTGCGDVEACFHWNKLSESRLS
jgi:hypothetical protein